ncbi:MAG TPA: SulP family inorganic anion transporter [Anaerolineae bacterium]|jgi:SulP family sulfate permease
MNIALIKLLRDEFRNYNPSAFQKDLLAGLTVAAVALPLALAFGIASGADPAAGLVTAIIAGFVIGALSGGPYMISGPTGAMSAVLILIGRDHGLPGIWLTGVIAGLAILLVGVFKLGRTVLLIPRPVITGFTSGIAIIIFVGQIDNFLGVKTSGADSAALKLLGFARGGFTVNWQSIVTASIVMATMFGLPRSISRRVPGSLVGIVLATAVALGFGFAVPVIGDVPRSLILDNRLVLSADIFNMIPQLIVPAASIAALGAIESLLCGTVCAKTTGRKLDSDQELIAQGIGNIIIPFFGGVPDTAAIARSSVGITSGGVTRLTSIIHSLALLAVAMLLGPVIGRVPLAALAGVLMATAIRMNEWDEIRWMVRHRFRSVLIIFGITMVATASLDLTQAIIIGVALSALFFVYNASDINVTRKDVDLKTMQMRGHAIDDIHPAISVAYISGPMFFGATTAFRKAFADVDCERVLILSMRGVSLIDVSGLELIEELHAKMKNCRGEVMLCGVQPAVKRILDQTRLTHEIGDANFFWSADQAILEANRRLMAPSL